MKKSLSIANANLLYLITMVLLITVGSIIQVLHLSLGLIGTELFLIMLPAIIFLLIKKVPLKEGLRLNKISFPVAVVSLLLGVATYLFSILIEIVIAKITGLPSVDLSQSALPQSFWQYALYFVAIAVSAPLGEEILFRGAIQGSYEKRKSTVFAISLPALMFAFYHFRLSGLPGLLPVAFLIGYVAWRSRSIISTMLVHFGMNAMAAIVTILSLSGSKLPGYLFDNVWVSLGGFIAAILLLFVFIRIQPKPATEEPVEEPKSGWFKKYWALIVAFILYVVIVVSTLFAQLSGATASKNLVYEAPEISAPFESRYQVINRAGDMVGVMNCTVAPAENAVTLDCTETVEPYEVKESDSTWIDSGHTSTLHVLWSGETFVLQEYMLDVAFDQGGGYNSELIDGTLVTEASFEQIDDLDITGKPLFEHEWAWHVYALKPGGGTFYSTPYVEVMRWDNELKKNYPVAGDQLLRIMAGETLEVPAGKFETTKFTMKGMTVWYADDEQQTMQPIQIEDDMVTYKLMAE